LATPKATTAIHNSGCYQCNKGGNTMILRNRLASSPEQSKRSTRSVLLSLAALLAVSTMLCGCIVEPDHYHDGWGWHHHD